MFFLCVLGLSTAKAQDYNFGIKLGGNYTINNQGSEIAGSAGNFHAHSDAGYLGGIFFEKDLGKFFVRPEVFYNHAVAFFKFPAVNTRYTLDKLSMPLLVGYRVLNRVDVFVGPAYQLLINSELDNTPPSFNQKQRKLASQFGIKVHFTSFELDLRYDFTYPSDYNERIDIKNVMDDAYVDEGRLNQLMLSVNVNLFGSDQSKIPFRRH